jgi:hypothetical protein
MVSSTRLAVFVAGAVLLAGCATWSTSDVRAPGKPRASALIGRSMASGRPPTDPAAIALVEGDIADRPYQALADVSVVVKKGTIFHRAPTREMVAQRLREEAAKLGADAMILVRYGTLGGPAGWGSLDGNGRALVYK